jgi:Cytochrome c
MKTFVRLAVVASLMAGSTLASGQVLPGPPDPVEGHRLAIALCTPCHVVATDQELPPVLYKPAPPFLVIANRPNTTEASLRQFLLTTHSTMRPTFTMPNPALADYQLNAIVAYLLSLKGQH